MNTATAAAAYDSDTWMPMSDRVGLRVTLPATASRGPTARAPGAPYQSNTMAPFRHAVDRWRSGARSRLVMATSNGVIAMAVAARPAATRSVLTPPFVAETRGATPVVELESGCCALAGPATAGSARVMAMPRRRTRGWRIMGSA